MPIIGEHRESLASKDKACCHVLAAWDIEGSLSMLNPRVECVCKERVVVQRFVKLLLGVDCSVLESALGEVGCANCCKEGMGVRVCVVKKVVECLLNRVIYRHEVRRKTITPSLNSTHE